jgi:hypothetical protein
MLSDERRSAFKGLSAQRRLRISMLLNKIENPSENSLIEFLNKEQAR